MKLYTWVLSRVIFVVLAIAVLLLLSSGNPEATKAGQLSPKYDPTTEVVTTGVVEEVRIFDCLLSGGPGIHLALRTNTKPLIVHVAPTRFTEAQQFTVAKGDQVKTTGAKVRYRGGEALIAREIATQDQIFTFRRPDGKPLWEE